MNFIEIESFPTTVHEDDKNRYSVDLKDALILNGMQFGDHTLTIKDMKRTGIILWESRKPFKKILYKVVNDNIVFDLDDAVVVYDMFGWRDIYKKIIYGESLKFYIGSTFLNIFCIGNTVRCFRDDTDEIWYCKFPSDVLNVKHRYKKYSAEFGGLDILTCEGERYIDIMSVIHELENLKNSAEWYLLKKVGRDVLSIIEKYLK